MIMVVVFVATIELGWIILRDLYNQPRFFLSIADLKEIFGFFLLVLIGIDLLQQWRLCPVSAWWYGSF